MCGICGKLNFDRGSDVSPALIRRMADTMHHRGPDDNGYYVAGQVGLGFRRLSIIDLNTGHQPMSNEDGTVWIIFNGEIYNYKELRQDLIARGHRFASQSDTEVIVHLFEEYGPSCVAKLRGMFGFAVWDQRTETLFLARDRVGIKPLYYAVSGASLWFASEMKAILADPEVDREISPAAINRCLTFKYLPGSDTLLRNVRKLTPGSYLIIRRARAELHRYWDLSFESRNIPLKEAETTLAGMLEEAVALHMRSDVPVGFLLSGGVDSTAMLSMASQMTDRQTSSFTVGFDGPGVIDERPYARLAAGMFGTVHHEISITSRDFESFLPDYIWHMEEPVCEPPAVALYYVSRLARQSVKVLISGEGGDEAFGGYPVYRYMLWLEGLRRAAGPLRGPIAFAADRIAAFAGSPRLRKYARHLGLPRERAYYGGLSNRFGDTGRGYGHLYTADFLRVIEATDPLADLRGILRSVPTREYMNQMLYVDTRTWLPDDLLVKADKMTMANSIELRVPLLDHKVLEFAASLPGNYKVRGVQTKYLLKRVLGRCVPKEILKRKKAGFPVPYGAWLRADMSQWLQDVLLDRTSLQRGYFTKSGIEVLLGENRRTGRHAKDLFTLAVLELWHRAFLKEAAAIT